LLPLAQLGSRPINSWSYPGLVVGHVGQSSDKSRGRETDDPLPEERNVPTNVGCQPQQERQPPENQDAQHANFVVCQPQTFWQKVGPGSKSDIQPPGFRNASERCVRCGQRVKGPLTLFRNLRLNTFVKKENDRGPTPGVCAIPLLACQDSSHNKPIPMTTSSSNIKSADAGAAVPWNPALMVWLFSAMIESLCGGKIFRLSKLQHYRLEVGRRSESSTSLLHLLPLPPSVAL
jgi:hypothetical protein